MSADVAPAPPAAGRAWAEAAAVFLVAAAGLAWVILPAGALGTIDGYYHLKVAQLMAREGPVVDIRWLPLTVLGERGTDQHWLWHLLLVPFALGDDLFLGLKWALVVTAAAVPAALAWVLRRSAVPWAGLFALVGFVGAALIPGRMAMARAQNLAVVFMALALLALARRRPVLLGVLAALFMLGYHGAVILVPLTVLWGVVVVARERTVPWRAGLAVAAGLLGGLVASPWFPDNVEYLLFHTLFKVGNPHALPVGLEWASPPLEHVLLESAWLHGTLAAALGWALWRRRLRLEADTWLWLGAAGLMLALYLGAWRFAEYYVPIGAGAAGLCLRDAWAAAPPRPALRWTVAAALLAVVAFRGDASLRQLERNAVFPPDRLAPIAEALRAEAARDEVVFNRQWEDFVFLFWNDAGVRYVSGLDPNYLAYGDPARFAAWSWLGGVGPDEPRDPAQVLREQLGVRFAVVDRRAAGLAARLERSPGARAILATPEARLYRLDPPARP